jgi:hypothetical protein
MARTRHVVPQRLRKLKDVLNFAKRHKLNIFVVSNLFHLEIPSNSTRLRTVLALLIIRTYVKDSNVVSRDLVDFCRISGGR